MVKKWTSETKGGALKSMWDEIKAGLVRFWNTEVRGEMRAALRTIPLPIRIVVPVLLVLAAIGGVAGAVSGGGDNDEDGDTAQSVATRTPDEPSATRSPTRTQRATRPPTASPTVAPTLTPGPTALEPPLPSYQVIMKEDVSAFGSVRISVAATTGFPLTKDQARAVMDAIIKEVIDDSEVNAVVVFLYDWPELVNGGYTLAKATFAPDGDWGSAGEVETGDYSRHETVYEFTPKMDDPQAALADRPSQREAQMCGAWDEAAQEYSPWGELDDQAIAEIVAPSFGVSPEEVLDAVRKCVYWLIR